MSKPRRSVQMTEEGLRVVVWTDDMMLKALHMMDHQGLTAKDAGRALGVTKNSILGIRFRCLTESWKHFPTTQGDGTMAPDWWVR